MHRHNTNKGLQSPLPRSWALFGRPILEPPRPGHGPLPQVVFAATNRIDQLDPALLRPGRFDKVVHVDIPSGADRAHLFEYYMAGLALVNPESGWRAKYRSLHDAENSIRSELAQALAAATGGMTPAHVSCICNEAALIAATEGSSFVSKAHFERAAHEAAHGVSEKGRGPRSELALD